MKRIHNARSYLAAFTLFASGISALPSIAQSDPGCDHYRSYVRWAHDNPRAMTPDEARHWIALHEAALAQTPTSPCADGMKSELIALLPLVGRTGEAYTLADQSLTSETNPRRRMLLSNNLIALRLQESGRNLSQEQKQTCRVIALSGLARVGTIEEMLEASEFHDIASAMPLHHIVASTEPAATRRLESLTRLLDRCSRANIAAEARAEQPPCRLDVFLIAQECIRTRRETTSDLRGIDLVPYVCAVPWATTTQGPYADSLYLSIVCDKSLPLQTRMEFTQAMAAHGPHFGLRVQASHQFMMDECSSALIGPKDVAALTRAYTTAATQWNSLKAFECTHAPGELPPGIDSASQWNALVRGALSQMWHCGYFKLRRCDLGLEPALEHIARFPEVNPTPAMQRMLAECGP